MHNPEADMLIERLEDERFQRLKDRVRELRGRFTLRREKWKVTLSALISCSGLVWHIISRR
jgi:hypothetical protein